MELKEFVKKVILDLDLAVSEANTDAKREVVLRESRNKERQLNSMLLSQLNLVTLEKGVVK